MKSTAALLAVGLATTMDTASAAEIVKVTTPIGDFSGSTTFSQKETSFTLNAKVGTSMTGTVTMKSTVKLTTPGCDSAKASIKLTGDVGLALPKGFKTAYDAAKFAIKALPSFDDKTVDFSKDFGTGETLKYDIPVSNHPAMKISGSSISLEVDLTKVGIMAKGVKIPLQLNIKVLDKDNIDTGVKCKGTSKPCDVKCSSRAFGVCTDMSDVCVIPTDTLCGALKALAPTPLISYKFDVWDLMNKTKANDMFVKCADGKTVCLGIGDVSGKCTAASKLSGDENSATSLGAMNAAIMGLIAAMTSVFYH